MLLDDVIVALRGLGIGEPPLAPAKRIPKKLHDEYTLTCTMSHRQQVLVRRSPKGNWETKSGVDRMIQLGHLWPVKDRHKVCSACLRICTPKRHSCFKCTQFFNAQLAFQKQHPSAKSVIFGVNDARNIFPVYYDLHKIFDLCCAFYDPKVKIFELFCGWGCCG